MTARRRAALITLVALSGSVRTAWAQQSEPDENPAAEAPATTGSVNSATVTGSGNTTNSNNLTIYGPVTIEAPPLPSPTQPLPSPTAHESSPHDAPNPERWSELARGVALGAAGFAVLSGATYYWAGSRHSAFVHARDEYLALPPDAPLTTEQDAWQRMLNTRDDTRQLLTVSIVGAALSLAAGIVAGTFWLVAPDSEPRIGVNENGVRLVF
jgi:ABC-type dipeptide/oligopeptide/nickel transport system permease subunit